MSPRRGGLRGMAANVALLMGSMAFVVLKVILRLALSVKYVLVTDFFNI